MTVVSKYFIGWLFITFLSFFTFGQTATLAKPPTYENTYLFKVLDYKRQPKLPKYIQDGIKHTLEIPISQWTAKDSLFFAYKNVHLQKNELALKVFSQLNTDTITEKHGQMLYQTALFQMREYTSLKEYNERKMERDVNVFYNIKDAFLDLNTAYIKYDNDEFDLDTGIVFPVIYNDTLNSFNHNAPPNENKIVEVAFAIDSAFRQFTVLHNNRDVILSKAFEEMGDFQKKYLYLTNAYFYYGAAIHYNRNNAVAIEKYNLTKNEMAVHNFISVSFKSKFGKVIKNRFRLKDNIAKEENKINPIQNAVDYQDVKPKKDYLPWIDVSLLIIIIVALLLVFVMIFLKTKED